MERPRPHLFTNEIVIFKSGIEKADLSDPVSVLVDREGNHALTDGNHRAYKAYLNNSPHTLPRKIIGTISDDVSSNPNFRKIEDLQVINR